MTSEPQVTEVRTDAAGSAPAAGAAGWSPGSWLRWESALVLLLAAVLVFGATSVPNFFSGSTLFYLGINTGYVALMALPMTLVVVSGEIDLSVASMLGLAGATFGFLWHHGWSFPACLVVVVLVGLLGGVLNGALVAKVGLPSIAVTIGTLALFRGIAEVLLGSRVVPGAGDRQFPTTATDLGVVAFPFTYLAYGFVVFLVLAAVTGVLLHSTTLGRSIIAIGLQPDAAAFAGIRVRWVRFWLFVAAGVVSALAGLIYTFQVSSISYTAGTGLELNVVAIVLFGGVSIFGGRGTVLGVVLSVLILGSLQIALTQLEVDPNVQNVITGVLLLLSVVIPNGGEVVRRLRARSQRGRLRTT